MCVSWGGSGSKRVSQSVHGSMNGEAGVVCLSIRVRGTAGGPDLLRRSCSPLLVTLV